MRELSNFALLLSHSDAKMLELRILFQKFVNERLVLMLKTELETMPNLHERA